MARRASALTVRGRGRHTLTGHVARAGGTAGPVRFCDESDIGFGWVLDEFLQRCSHALVASGRVWLIDPLNSDRLQARIEAAGTAAGVIQLLDRHERDCGLVAERFGVPHYRLPRTPLDGAPFEFRVVRDRPRWREVALWWPAERLLVCGDALGTVPELRVGGEPLALHPLLRLMPPRRQLAGIEPRYIWCGHGEGVNGDDAAPAMREALSTARRRLPRAWLQGASAVWRRRRTPSYS